MSGLRSHLPQDALVPVAAAADDVADVAAVDALHRLEVAGLVAALGAGHDGEALLLGLFVGASSTLRMPGPSTATGFSVKRFLPASTAASMWIGRKPGGVARMT